MKAPLVRFRPVAIDEVMVHCNFIDEQVIQSKLVRDLRQIRVRKPKSKMKLDKRVQCNEVGMTNQMRRQILR